MYAHMRVGATLLAQDLGSSDVTKQLYIVCQIYRNGALLDGDKGKEKELKTAGTKFRCVCVRVCVPNCFKPLKNIPLKHVIRLVHADVPLVPLCSS